MQQHFPARTSPPSLEEIPDSMRQVQVSILDEYSSLHDAFMETGCELARLAMTLGEEPLAESSPVANHQPDIAGERPENGNQSQANGESEEIPDVGDQGPLLVTLKEFAKLVGKELQTIKNIGTKEGAYPAAVQPQRGSKSGLHDFTQMAAWYLQKRCDEACNVPTLDQARRSVAEFRAVST